MGVDGLRPQVADAPQHTHPRELVKTMKKTKNTIDKTVPTRSPPLREICIMAGYAQP
jgi:hypothetical protein